MVELKEKLVNSLTGEEKLYRTVLYMIKNLEIFEKESQKGLLFNISNDGIEEFKKVKMIKKLKKNGFDVEKNSIGYKEDLVQMSLNNIAKFYKALDENKDFTNDSIKKVGEIYQNLKETEKDQKKILLVMYDIFSKSGVMDYEDEIKAIISYCIMKCEVLDNE